MRLQSVVALSLACLVAGQGRISLVTNCLNDVTGGVDALNEAETKLTADNIGKDSAAIQGYVGKIVGTLKGCTAKFSDFSKGGTKFNILEAMQMQNAGTKLGEGVKKGVDTIISKKDIVVKAGLKDTIKNQLKDILAATSGFNSALLDTLPPLAKTAAEPSVKEPVTAIEKAIAAYD
jgi:hypothetical protein